MSIENTIEKLTAAVVRNNELLEKVIAFGAAPAPVAVWSSGDKPAKPSVVAPKEPEPVVAEVEVLPKEEPAVGVTEIVIQESEEPATDGFADHATGIRAIKEYAKAKYAEAGERLPDFQAAYASLREEFGIGKKTEELKDEQLMPFYLRLQEVLK